MDHRAACRAILACTALALAACGGSASNRALSDFHSKTAEVEFDMPKARVQHVMGVPNKRLYSGSQEAWLWCETSNNASQADAFLAVYFHNARVAGIHTYGNRAEGTCDSFFRRVEWLADPEKAMAAKVRRRE